MTSQTKPSLLFIGHTYHLKTKSSVFLLDMLKEAYDVSELYMDPDKPYVYSEFEKFSDMSFDILVVWQITPNITELKKLLHWQRGVFFPMYDHYQAMRGLRAGVWKEFQQFLIICFSKALQHDLTENGFDTRYIQYFPKPADIQNWGDEHSLFFWQRLSFLDLSTLAKAIGPLDIHHIHLHKAVDPGHDVKPLTAYDEETKSRLKGIDFTDSTWFEHKSDLDRAMEQSAIYMAPRHYEGIGMSFLEAMAHGRCVIASDTPTMNEYITDGVNGLLYPWQEDSTQHCGRAVKAPKRNIQELQHNAYQTIVDGYAAWTKEKHLILQWLQENARPDQEKLTRCAFLNEWQEVSFSALPKETANAIRYYRPELRYAASCLLHGRIKELRHFLLIHFNSRFKREWYYMLHPDTVSTGLPAAAHYLHTGWKEGYDPSTKFSTKRYIALNPDVREMDMCPLLHWKLIGKKEKRRW